MILKVEEQKQVAVLNSETWGRVEKIAQVAPIIKLMALEGMRQSDLKEDPSEDIQVTIIN